MSDKSKEWFELECRLLENKQDHAWSALIHHKDQIHKLTYWSMGLLAAILTFTQFFGGMAEGAKAAAVHKLLVNPFFFVTFYWGLLFLLLFFLHHHLAIRFYGALLRKYQELVENLYESNIDNAKNVTSVHLKSPYAHYTQICCHKKRFASIFGVRGRATKFGGSGAAGLMLIVLGALFFLFKYAVQHDTDLSHLWLVIVNACLTVPIVVITMLKYDEEYRRIEHGVNGIFSED